MPIEWRIQSTDITIEDDYGNSVIIPDYGSLTIDEIDFYTRCQALHADSGMDLLTDCVVFSLRHRSNDKPEIAWDALRLTEAKDKNADAAVAKNREIVKGIPGSLLRAIFERLTGGKPEAKEDKEPGKQSTGAKFTGDSKSTIQETRDSQRLTLVDAQAG